MARQGVAWYYDYKRFDDMNKKSFHYTSRFGMARLCEAKQSEALRGRVW